MTRLDHCSSCGALVSGSEGPPYRSHKPDCFLVKAWMRPADIRIDTDQGRKDDSEKPRWDLLPLDALQEVVRVLTYGARKYADNNWQHVEGAAERYRAAGLRHHAARAMGEMRDPETGLLHSAHEACCVLFRVFFDLREKDPK